MRKVSSPVWVVFLLFSGTFINAIDRASLSVAVPIMMTGLKLDKTTMGIALSAFFWVYMLASVPVGKLGDKYGAKRTMGWCAALWSVCSALTGSAKNLVSLILARVGVGLGEAASFPISAKIVNNSVHPHRRGTAVAFYSAGLRLGFAVTPILMGWLMVTCGWRAAFFLTGVASLAWVALWIFTCDEVQPDHSQPAQPKIPMFALLKNRTVLGLMLCKFFQDYLFYLFVTWLPGYLVLGRGFSIINMGWCAAVPWVAGCIAQPVMGWLSDALIRRGVSITVSRKSLIVVLQLLAASVVAAGYVSNAMTAVWLLTLSVACESAAAALLWTICTDVAPPSAAGSLAGIKNTAGALAGILAPFVTGYLAEQSGSFQVPLLLGGVMVIFAAACILFVVGELKPILIPGK